MSTKQNNAARDRKRRRVRRDESQRAEFRRQLNELRARFGWAPLPAHASAFSKRVP